MSQNSSNPLHASAATGSTAALATEATVATRATDATLAARAGAVRNKTTPTKADATKAYLDVDAVGNLYVDATLAHQRPLTLGLESAVVAADALVDLYEGSCHGLSCETADIYVYGQPRESPQLVQDTTVAAGHWVLGAGWTAAGTVISHTAGGGFTNDLEYTVQTTYPILVGLSYCLVFAVASRTAGDVTGKVGTGAGTARSADGTYIDCVTAAGTGKVIFTPTDTFDGSIDLASVKVYPYVYLPTAGEIKAFAMTRIVGVAAKGTPATLVASPGTAIVRAHWHRRAGHVEA